MSSERTLLDESRITRRHVLQAFGVLGGSSLVMGVMDAWGLMGASAAQRPALQGPRDGYAGHRAGCRHFRARGGIRARQAGLRLAGARGPRVGERPAGPSSAAQRTPRSTVRPRSAGSMRGCISMAARGGCPTPTRVCWGTVARGVRKCVRRLVGEDPLQPRGLRTHAGAEPAGAAGQAGRPNRCRLRRRQPAACLDRRRHPGRLADRGRVARACDAS